MHFWEDLLWDRNLKRKGQIAIPVELRRDLDLKSGDRFLVILRQDRMGFTPVKTEVMDELFRKLQEGG